MTGSAQSGRIRGSLDPPAPFRQTAPGILRITRGGGAIALFGTPFFLVGVAILLGATGVVLMRKEGGGPATVLAPMGLVFLVVGGVMVFGRQWLVIDLGRRVILRQIGLLVPLRTEERSLGEFHAVVISHDRGDSESPETYPVTLRASNGKNSVIVKPLHFGESLATAEYLARAVSLQLIDATTDREIRVSPERAGESLGDRFSGALAGAPPERPASMRSDVTESAAGTRIVMPGGGQSVARYAGIVLPIVIFFIAMVIAIPVLLKSANPLTLFCMLLVIFGVPTWFTSIRSMLSKGRAVTVTASSVELVIEQPKGGKTQTTAIPVEDVFDVDYSTFESAIAAARQSGHLSEAHATGDERVLRTLKKLVPNPGIVIKSRAGLITIGEGLPADELQYLVWLIRTALTGQSVFKSSK